MRLTSALTLAVFGTGVLSSPATSPPAPRAASLEPRLTSDEFIMFDVGEWGCVRGQYDESECANRKDDDTWRECFKWAVRACPNKILLGPYREQMCGGLFSFEHTEVVKYTRKKCDLVQKALTEVKNGGGEWKKIIN
ncbi:Uu.00g091170.m01.CDS01 [Anthostomella pinea]|uniref:Uu.00g091170.m01.CDS01 n=1 Tax=Anthostomella pinea TaxID=933095 RepID=A0AAI8VNZ5_9PEZI|nr:Uu.00g091170.m01.CDS01 [Anthostomella pinea]